MKPTNETKEEILNTLAEIASVYFTLEIKSKDKDRKKEYAMKNAAIVQAIRAIDGNID
ncbi:MAG: hypothetical protein RR091_10825 [Cloacibacillus sp.]